MFLGIDIGTSAIRIFVIDESENIIFSCANALPKPILDDKGLRQDPYIWLKALHNLLAQAKQKVLLNKIHSICTDGTSGTALLVDKNGAPIDKARMYNDKSDILHKLDIIKDIPQNSLARGDSSTFARLMQLINDNKNKDFACLLHQADWINAQFSAKFNISDVNNALKSGFDIINQKWADWMDNMPFDKRILPKVLYPGDVIGNICEAMIKKYGFNKDCLIIAGSTDGNAAFLASNDLNSDMELGHAMSSLGTTLTIKMLSLKPIFEPKYGIYSHYLFDKWLVGGASNSGGEAIGQFFSINQMQILSKKINPNKLLNLGFYPLPRIGERFPINDPHKKPIVKPRPKSDEDFLQGLFEGVAQIEKRCYKLLCSLGAPKLTQITTTGGGSKNHIWSKIRQNILKVKIKNAHITDAGFGAAKLAKYGVAKYKSTKA